MKNSSWKLQAACRNEPDLFLEETHFSASEGTPRGSEDAVGRAKKVCLSCPVRQDCYDAAMDDEAYLGGTERHGIRGGLTARDRILIAAKDPTCARCPNPVAKWQRICHIKRLCRSCQQLALHDPSLKYSKN